MARLAPRALETDLGFRELMDALPVGMAYVDRGGRMVDCNASAEALFASGAGAALEATVARLLDSARDGGRCVQACCELGGAERVVVSVAPDRTPNQFLVVLDRQRLEKARAEATVLREVLRAIASSASRRDAVQRAVSTVQASLAVQQLVFFELDPSGVRFTCVASAGLLLPEDCPHAPVANDAASSLLAVALGHGRPLHVLDAAAESSRLPCAPASGTSALLMAIGRRGPRGVLCALAPAGTLGEGSLRVLQALADAIEALQDLVAFEAAAELARDVAAQRDRLATIGQLVAGVAHEINNPLAFIKSNLTTLQSEAAELIANNEVGELAQVVSESLEGVHRIEAIVQALKSTARKSQEKVRFDVAKAVSEAATIFRGAKKAECEVEVRVEPSLDVFGSPSAIGQVVLNLLQNGLDAMGTVERRARKLELAAWAKSGQVHFTVRDHGTGIAPEVQRRMFDAFYTTKEPGKGTGLGLYICRDIVEGLGGQLRFTTGPEGTTFEAELPAAGAAT